LSATAESARTVGDRPAPPELPPPRGPLSAAVVDRLRGGSIDPALDAPVIALPTDDDVQLALYLSYELHYRGFREVDERLEWDLGLLGLRLELEASFEAFLHDRVPVEPLDPVDVPNRLRELVAASRSEVAGFLGREADVWHYEEFLIHRSAYHLKEADPHSWGIPRLDGAAKAALVEIQADEYGGGDPAWVHSLLFGRSMETLGLDSTYGSYLPRIPGVTLANVNLMSLFGLHRRYRGASVGHLAAFELGSARPNRLYGDGLRRLGFDDRATVFFDEHVEADSIHDMIATYDLAGQLAMQEPQLAPQILFGARSLSTLDAAWSSYVLSSWGDGATSLRRDDDV